MAISVAAMKPGKPCRGQCFLEEDGTLYIDAALLDSSTSNNATSTNPLPPSLKKSPSVATFENVAVPSSSGDDQILPSHVAQQPIYKSLRNFTLAGQPPPILYCPCNCTYVSAACCLSRTVWEEPSKSVLMKPPPSDATVCCDTSSGKWLPKSGECPLSWANGSVGGGFDPLGTVKWNGRPIPQKLAQQNKPDP